MAALLAQLLLVDRVRHLLGELETRRGLRAQKFRVFHSWVLVSYQAQLSNEDELLCPIGDTSQNIHGQLELGHSLVHVEGMP